MWGKGSRNYDPRSTTRSMACLTSVFIQADLKTVTSSQALWVVERLFIGYKGV